VKQMEVNPMANSVIFQLMYDIYIVFK